MTTENFKNKIQRLELENFTCFSKATFDFSSGINVFIGENGTGKTHVLKMLCSLFETQLIQQSLDLNVSEELQKEYQRLRIGINLKEFFKFKGKGLTEIIRKNEISNNLNVRVIFDKSNGKSQFIKFFSHDKNYRYQTSKGLDEFLINHNNLLFVPTHEMLSLYNGFIASYERRENSFDASYYTLAKKLNALKLKENNLFEQNILLRDLFVNLNIEVYQKDNQFYLKLNNEGIEIEAPLAAEGIKKLAQMIYLIQNGSLTKDTILFWDEPEVNLNPKYIKIVAKFLQTLAKNGVQIFVATHDYLLVHLLSLDAEYQQITEAPQMRFFALSKGENGTEVEFADTIAGITNNALLDEYSAYSELEHQLFKKSMQTV
jgi:predicted ATP-dependent endonuclease of OLD family